MEKDGTETGNKAHLVVRIVRSYVAHHRLAAGDLAGLIEAVHVSLGQLRQPAPETENLVPAVPVKRSVQRDHVVCVECGFRATMLRRHLGSAHGLDPAAYRARWKLPSDYPLVAPTYSEQRSMMAKQLGFGRKRAAVAASPAPAADVPPAEPARLDPTFAASLSGPKRRGRKPRAAPAA